MKVKTIIFEKTNDKPLYEQIYRKLRNDILNGYLKKGDQLPSIRQCEELCKVSKTTVERAFQKLYEEGYLLSKPQIGYFVDVDEEHLNLRKSLHLQPLKKREIIRYDFRSQSMDIDAFDITLWKKYLKEVLDRHQEISTYGEAQGEIELRMALQKYAYSMRGVLCDSKQIVIGSSFQSLLYLLCGLLPKDSIVGIGEGGFAQAETVFQDYGLQVEYLHIHKDGISIAELNEKKVSLLYLNSGTQGKNHQPLLHTKRAELLQWAKEHHAYIIEDDHNGELRYQSKVIASMQGYDMGKNVLYIGSFSKLLLPSLRISYLVLNEELLNFYLKRKDCYAPTSSKIEQLALANYITDGHLERHVKRLRKRYLAKSTTMRKLLQKYFPQVECILEEAALQFILRFPYDVNFDECIDQARNKQIFIQKTSNQEVVLSFAAMKEEMMEEAIQEVSLIMRKQEKQI